MRIITHTLGFIGLALVCGADLFTPMHPEQSIVAGLCVFVIALIVEGNRR